MYNYYQLVIYVDRNLLMVYLIFIEYILTCSDFAFILNFYQLLISKNLFFKFE